MEKKLEAYKKKFNQLYEVFNDRNKYIQKLDKLMDELQRDKKLVSKVDISYIRLIFENCIPNLVKGEFIEEQFYSSVEKVFSIKQYFYYFHLSKLNNFPEGYKLGYGVFKNWDSLPEEVKNEFNRVMVLNQSPYPVIDDETWKRLSAENKLIFNSPHTGQWLEIQIEGVFGPNMQNEAFRQAELSMDILRVVLFSGIVEPFSYTVIYDPKSHNVNIGVKISFTGGVDYFGDVKERGYDENINRLNKLVEKPSKIEKRIIQALKFLRIGDYISEDQNRIFYYAAGIEKMILDNEPEISHKFSLRGSFLLGNNSKERRLIFNDLKDIYRKRSGVAHGSIIEYDYRLTLKANRYIKGMILKLLKIIDEHNIIDVKKDREKNTLVNYIEQKIFPENEQNVDS